MFLIKPFIKCCLTNIILKLTIMKNQIILGLFAICGLTSCSDSSHSNYEEIPSYPFVVAEFGTSINLNNLANYANQQVPS